MGRDGLISGSRAALRLLPRQRGALVLLTNGSTGRAPYRSLFPILLEAWFGVAMPALRLEPSGGAGDNPTVTFGGFDAGGRPAVLYDMLWGLPRVEPRHPRLER